jgi:hypothetical protein
MTAFTVSTSLTPDLSQARRHLELLGYTETEPVYLRSFGAKHLQRPGKNFTTSLGHLPATQAADRAVYVVVNGGGQTKADIEYGRALFCEFDEAQCPGGKEEMLQRILDSALPTPTCMVETRHSIHAYWVFDEPVPIADWQALTLDLIPCLGSDPTIKDPSRVMRLAGYHHTQADKATGELVEPVRCELIGEDGHRYSFQELRALIPHREAALPLEATTTQAQATTPATRATVDGSRQLSDILTRDILPRLSPEQAFNWPGHNFQWSGSDKARGYCPWHESQSGTAFHIERNGKNGEWLAHCPSCDWGGGVLEYRHKLAGGSGSPRGREFVELVKQLAQETWVELPTLSPRGGAVAQEEESPNRWNAPASWRGELGWWVEKEDEAGEPYRVFVPQTNFDFQVERELSSPSGEAGLVLQVKRSIDKQQRRVVVLSKDRTRVTDFIAALTRAYGCDLACNLKLQHLNALIHVRLLEYHQRGGRVFKLADRVGQQVDGTWVFPNCQYTAAGVPTTEEESGWVFNTMLAAGEDTIPSPEPATPDAQALQRLVEALTRFVGPEAAAQALLTLGWVAAGLHYQTIMKRERRFPLLNLVGDPGGFKTIIMEAALSLVGNHHGMMARTSESALYERLARCGGIPQAIDDPERGRALDELGKRIYNAVPRVLRGIFQEPHSPLGITSNHAVGDDQPATWSRIARLFCQPSTLGDPTAYDDLQEAMANASGALPQLLALGYPADEVRAQAAALRPHLPQAHARVADTWGLILHYAKAVARLSGYPEHLLEDYVVNTVCAAANTSEANKTSLADFLERVEALVASGHAGGWNTRAVVDKTGRELIAVYMPSVWPEVDRQFKPPYSRAIIQAAIAKAGGSLSGVQRFYRTRDEALAYQRALLSPQGENTSPPQEPDTTPRKCVLIPAACAPELYLAIQPPHPEPLQETYSPEPPAGPEEPVTSVTSCYPSVTSKGNSEKPCPEDVSGGFSESVTFSKKMATSEKTDAPSGDTPQGECEESNGNVATFEKKVTDHPQQPSNPDAARDSAVTFLGNREVTAGNTGNSATPHAALHQPPSGLEDIPWDEIVWDDGTSEINLEEF